MSDHSNPSLNVRVMDYLNGVFSERSMFGTWDLIAIMNGMKEIVNVSDYICICIAATWNGHKRCVKVAEHVNPVLWLESLNSSGANKTYSSRRTVREHQAWKMLAYLVLDRREIVDADVSAILKCCKSKRQLCDRILYLLHAAEERHQSIRIALELIISDNDWYMHGISDRLRKIPGFVKQFETSLCCDSPGDSNLDWNAQLELEGGDPERHVGSDVDDESYSIVDE